MELFCNIKLTWHVLNVTLKGTTKTFSNIFSVNWYERIFYYLSLSVFCRGVIVHREVSDARSDRSASMNPLKRNPNEILVVS